MSTLTEKLTHACIDVENETIDLKTALKKANEEIETLKPGEDNGVYWRTLYENEKTRHEDVKKRLIESNIKYKLVLQFDYYNEFEDQEFVYTELATGSYAFCRGYQRCFEDKNRDLLNPLGEIYEFLIEKATK